MDRWLVIGSMPVRGHKPGAEFSEAIPAEQAERLQASGALQHLGPESAPEKTDDLLDLTREQLDELAVEAGVENPGDLPNKGEVAEAIRAAEETPDASGSNDNEEE
jgi:hypothetical protein